MRSRRPSAPWRPVPAAPVLDPGRSGIWSDLAGRQMTPRQKAVLDLLARLDRPVDAEALAQVVRDSGLRIPLSSLYRIVASLVSAGLIVELRTLGRRRYLSADKAVNFRLEDADGRPLATEAPGLRALLTLIAVEQGLPLEDAEVVIRFESRTRSSWSAIRRSGSRFGETSAIQIKEIEPSYPHQMIPFDGGRL